MTNKEIDRKKVEWKPGETDRYKKRKQERQREFEQLTFLMMIHFPLPTV